MNEDRSKLIERANSALLDIHRGFSVLKYGGRDFYFKHFSLEDTLMMDEFYVKSLENAKKSGIKTESELIEQAIKRASWSIKKEEEIKSLIWTRDKLIAASNKANDPLQKKTIMISAEEKDKQIKSLNESREKIINYSAESFASNKRTMKLLESSCFLDSSFKEPVDLDEVSKYALSCFSKIGELSQRDFLLNVAYNTSFFEIYMLQYRQPENIFGRSGLKLSIFQKTLLSCANSLLNKLKNTTIPDSIMNDPVKVLNYDEKRDSKSKTSEGVGDLREKMASRGGVLKPEDFL